MPSSRASESTIDGTTTIVRSAVGIAVAHRELWQLARRNLRGDDEIEQADDQLADRKDDDRGDQPQLRGRRAVTRRVHEEAGDAERRSSTAITPR